MTKLLKVPYHSIINKRTSIEIVSSELDTLTKNHIATVPWSNFTYKPDVSFTIAYGADCIFLKYYVREAVVQAVYCRPNDPVHLDSCVEFFFALKGEKNYYNLEFNCIGTCHGAYGNNRIKRKVLEETLLNQIKYQSQIKKEDVSGLKFYWELTLIIPFEIFGFHHVTSLSNEHCKVNFYKCGDNLPSPHYLCWNDIQSPSPDFHLPEFFGDAQFIIA